jgi:hypothetical protein
MSKNVYKVSSWRGTHNLMYKSQIENKEIFEQGELEKSLIKNAVNSKSIVADRIASRDPTASISVNPYMVGNDYLEDLKIEDEFLRPKISNFKNE